MNETTIQNALYRHFRRKRHSLTVPNCGALKGEADLLSVTKADFVHEVEVKCCASDFRRDFETKWTKHWQLKNGENVQRGIPNYFWFATPPGVVEPAEVPDYAGLMHVGDGEVAVVRDAPRLHSEKLSTRSRRYITRGLSIRYWNQRLEIDA